MTPAQWAGAFVGFFLILILANAIKIVQEYERGVIFRLGRLQGAKGPGLFFIIPVIDRMVRVDLRIVTLDVPSQEIITRDNVTVRVNAVCYFRVQDSSDAVVQAEHYGLATHQKAQTTLRSILGQHDLDQLLSERDAINAQLQQIIDDETNVWGVKVTAVEVKDVELPEGMQRAIARQAEAERERRAKVINAEGEYQAAQRLAEAAAMIMPYPPAIQLRFLQTLREVATERNSTTIFPVPIDLFEAFTKRIAGEPVPPPTPPPASEPAPGEGE
ncbi:MAG: slipin family protein [Armatimonadota bacterium]|jgi:regulator of protease activity HflC (stomatin/prohibitin superfamily)